MDRETFRLICGVFPPEITEKIEAHLDSLYGVEVSEKISEIIGEYWKRKSRPTTGGGIFSLITNDGLQDRLLMASGGGLFSRITNYGAQDPLLMGSPELYERIRRDIKNEKVDSRKWRPRQPRLSRKFYPRN